MKFLLFMVLLLPSLMSNAAESPRLLPSVEWQKSILKRELENKVREALSTALKPNEYVVQAKIDLTTPKMPDFKAQPNNKPEEAKKKARSVIKDNKAPWDNDPYSYVVFHKLGLEVPLLEDFKDQITKEEGSENGLPNEYENIWKYNLAMDIFNNIDYIAISVKLTDTIKSEARPTLEGLVKSLAFDFASTQPEITFEYVNMHVPKNDNDISPPKPVAWWKKAFNILERFQLPLGLISAVALLGMFGMMLLNRYKKILEELGPQAHNVNMEKEEEKEIEEEKEDENLTEDNAMADQPAPVLMSSMERFQLYLEKAPRDCALMIKGWIRESGETQILGLSVLAEELDNEKLTLLVSYLAKDERSKMRTMVRSPMQPAEVIKGKEYIGIQVRAEIIKGENSDDPELQEMLMSLSPKKAAQLVCEQPQYTSLLFSKLTAKFIGMILELLPEEKKASILGIALTQKFFDDIKQFKNVLVRYADVELFSPVLEQIKVLIPDASRSMEETLYQAIAKHGNTQSVKACALRNYPAMLIPKLPAELLKEVLLHYDSVKRVEFLETLNPQEKEHFINSFAPAGSKARDIYEMDYERVCSDEQKLAEINVNIDNIYREFTDHLRTHLGKTTVFQAKIDFTISIWAEELAKKFSSVPDLKIVA
jgi:hypothetical protein